MKIIVPALRRSPGRRAAQSSNPKKMNIIPARIDVMGKVSA